MSINNHQYTDIIKHQRVLLIGIFPLPLGGISVHLKRVQHKLERQGCQVWAWDVCKQQQGSRQLRYYWRLWRFCWSKKPQVLIYHTMQLRSYPIELLLLLLAGRLLKSQNLVMIHSSRFIYRLNWLSLRLTGWVLGYYDQLILVSHAQRQEIGTKINLTGIKQILVESPFLAPDLGQASDILASLPGELQNFIKKHSPIISCAITRKDVWQGGDLYGLDLALMAFKRLQQEYSQAGLVLMIGDKTGYEQLECLPGVYILVDFQNEIWPLIGKTNLFIRPARSDSFGISVVEALSLNVPVVSSDVCVRPPGVILFKSGDWQDLQLKMQQVLSRVF